MHLNDFLYAKLYTIYFDTMFFMFQFFIVIQMQLLFGINKFYFVLYKTRPTRP